MMRFLMISNSEFRFGMTYFVAFATVTLLRIIIHRSNLCNSTFISLSVKTDVRLCVTFLFDLVQVFHMTGRMSSRLPWRKNKREIAPYPGDMQYIHSTCLFSSIDRCNCSFLNFSLCCCNQPSVFSFRFDVNDIYHDFICTL